MSAIFTLVNRDTDDNEIDYLLGGHHDCSGNNTGTGGIENETIHKDM